MHFGLIVLHIFQYASFTYQFFSHLSIYFSMCLDLTSLVEVRRVELLTSCLQGRRSSQTELYPHNFIQAFNVLLFSSTLKNKQ